LSPPEFSRIQVTLAQLGNRLRGLARRLTIEATGDGAVQTGKTCAGKGIFVIAGSDITVRNITFMRAAVPDRNCAGIREEGARI
jgi:hypothetical protein